MPKRVIVTTVWTCSLCGMEADEEKMTAYQLHGGGAKLALDVCATCAASDPWASVLAAGMSERAASTAKRKPVEQDPAAGTTCTVCAASFATPRGLSVHRKRIHGLRSPKEIRLATHGKVGDFPCPDCEFRAKGVQGLGSHRRTVHGVVGTSGTALRKRADATPPPPVEAPVRRRRKP